MSKLTKTFKLSLQVPRESFEKVMLAIITPLLSHIPGVPCTVTAADGVIRMRYERRFPWTRITYEAAISHLADTPFGTDIQVEQVATILIPPTYQNHFVRANTKMALCYAEAFKNGQGLMSVFGSMAVLHSANFFYDDIIMPFVQRYWNTAGMDGTKTPEGYRTFSMTKEFSVEPGSIESRPIEYSDQKWQWMTSAQTKRKEPIHVKKLLQFVVFESGQTVVGSQGHSILASYRHDLRVVYAGEVAFHRGQLVRWTNGSGHFQPFAGLAHQAPFHPAMFQNVSKEISIKDIMRIHLALREALRVPIGSDVIRMILEYLYPRRLVQTVNRGLVNAAKLRFQ